VSITVNKAIPGYTAPTGLTAAVGQTLNDITLPSGFSWDTEQNAVTASVGGTGNNTFKVQFTPTDTTNYSVVKNIGVNIAVSYPTFRVTIKTNNGVISVSRSDDSDAPIVLSKGAADSLTLSAEGYTSVVWYVDGTVKTGTISGTTASIVLNASAYDVRNHYITFSGVKGSVLYSTELTFTVTQ
jgi:hypothetical protein